MESVEACESCDRPSPERLTVGILVGGLSRRMGRTKALLPHPSGGTFLDHIYHVGRSCSQEVVFLGEMVEVPPGLQAVRRLPDAQPRAGPLAGLASLLQHVGEGWALLLSCDLPLIDGETLRRLIAGWEPDCSAIAFCLPNNAGRLQACCALYHSSLRQIVEWELQRSRRLQVILEMARPVALAPTDRDARALINVNTPEELAKCGWI
jgi:molybdopterin-guanine dinucleotide biosynthesis protein A